ncbi:MAG: hypothetical protein V1887_00120 [Candidatus Aenigmatarchaeota archaeon]
MNIIEWLDGRKDVQDYLKVGLILPEIMDAYCTEMKEMKKNPMERGHAAVYINENN